MNFRQDFLSFFPTVFWSVDMREANPTMVLTALQSESQAQRAAFWVKFQMPMCWIYPEPSIHPGCKVTKRGV